MSSLSYRVSRWLCGEWAGGYVVVAHKILLSAPVPWIGDLGLGLDNKEKGFGCKYSAPDLKLLCSKSFEVSLTLLNLKITFVISIPNGIIYVKLYFHPRSQLESLIIIYLIREPGLKSPIPKLLSLSNLRVLVNLKTGTSPRSSSEASFPASTSRLSPEAAFPATTMRITRSTAKKNWIAFIIRHFILTFKNKPHMISIPNRTNLRRIILSDWTIIVNFNRVLCVN